jgi:quercetin dioxygenase-like cupin family protein
MVIRHQGSGKWESVPVLAYKEDSGIFKDVTRQVLFDGNAGLPCQLRYFEIAPGGHSTLERHEHFHLVVVLRGKGRVLVGGQVHSIEEQDVITISSNTWHQFRAAADVPLGFLCLVNTTRDRPVLPTADDLRELQGTPEVSDFLRE